LSLADAENETLFPDGDVVVVAMSEGTLTTGAVVSTSVTVTRKDAEPVLLCASVAVHVTVVVPTAKVEPEAGEHDTPTEPSTLSLADAENDTFFPEGDVVVVEMFEGTLTAGGVVSTSVTVTWKEAEPVLLCPSVALQVTVVVPTAKVAPEAGEHDTPREPSTLSLADAENETLFPDGDVVVVAMSEGTLTTGAVVSTSVTVTWKEAEPVLLCASVALHVTVVVPIGNVAPEAGEHDAASEPSRLSLAEAENETLAPVPEVTCVPMSAGTVTTGGALSTRVTMTWNDSSSVPSALVTVHATVVVPTGKTSPEPWSHVGVVDGSLLETVNETVSPAADVVLTEISDGTVSTGTSADTGAACQAAAASEIATATTPTVKPPTRCPRCQSDCPVRSRAAFLTELRPTG
jgi:translation initiation factor IF-1